MTRIGQLTNRYLIGSLAIALVAGGAVYGVGHLLAPHYDHLLAGVLVSLGFFLAVCLAEGLIWKWVASRHPDSLPTFFTAVSGFRLLLALLVMLVWYLVFGRPAMLPFFLVFMAVYVAQLVYHGVFFSRHASLS